MQLHRWEPVATTKSQNLVSVPIRYGPYVARVEFRRSARTGVVVVGRITAAVELPDDAERELKRAAAKYLTRNLLDLQALLRG